MKTLARLLIFALVASTAPAQVPNILNYQGRVTVGGTNLTTNAALFKFALVNSNGSIAYWRNDGSTNAGEPTNAVTVAVTQGLYSTLLGDTALANMAAVPGDIFANADVNLRVWFSAGGTNPFVQLAPDQRLGAAGYALRAATADTATVTNVGGDLTVGGQLTVSGGIESSGAIVLRAPLATNPLSDAQGVNLVAGFASNNVTGGAVGATVSGGGGWLYGFPYPNVASDDFATVGGGAGNTAAGLGASVGGGEGNTASDYAATVGGGSYNKAIHHAATVSGGAGNEATASFATIGGGRLNSATNGYATVGGGHLNIAGAGYSTIGGGRQNMAYASFATVGGGFRNLADSNYATVAGGRDNVASGPFSAVGGGDANMATNRSATVGGGEVNNAGADYTTIAGGSSNSASALFAAVGGGTMNIASGDHSFVAGGNGNTASGSSANVSGGQTNTASAGFSTVSGGGANTAGGIHATVCGGFSNSATGAHATISGGDRNSAAGQYASVGGGTENVAGAYGTVPGGYRNSATAEDTFAAGASANAIDVGAFVWNGNYTVPTTSTNSYSFTVRAPGGTRFLSTIETNSNALVGVILTNGATAWASLSDSNAKTDIKPVEPRAILQKVAGMPVTSWHYKHDLNRRYIGPMAQDFHAAFGLGSDDKTISTLDSDGVMYAAIQGLIEELKDRDKAIDELKSELRALREQVQSTLPPAR